MPLPDPQPLWTDHALPALRSLGDRTYWAMNAIPLPALVLMVLFCAVCLLYSADARSPSVLPTHLSDLKHCYSLPPAGLSSGSGFTAPCAACTAAASAASSLFRPSYSLSSSSSNSNSHSISDANALPGVPVPLDIHNSAYTLPSPPSSSTCTCGYNPLYLPRRHSAPSSIGHGSGSGRQERGYRPAQTQTRRGSGRKGSSAWRCGLNAVPERDEEEGT